MKRTPYITLIPTLAGAASILVLLSLFGRDEEVAGISPEPGGEIVLTIGSMDRGVLAEGDSLRKESRYPEAITVYRKVLDAQGVHLSLRAEAEYNIGLSRLQMGEYVAAEAAFSRMLHTYAFDGETIGYARYCLAWMAMQRGRFRDAAGFLEYSPPVGSVHSRELAIRMQLLAGKVSRRMRDGAAGAPLPVLPDRNRLDGSAIPVPPPDGPRAVCWDLPVDVLTAEIWFAHGKKGGALDIRVDGGRDIPVPEYREHPFRSEPFAYSAGESPTVLVKFQASPPVPPFLIIDAISVAGGPMWNLRKRVVRFGADGNSLGDFGEPDHFVRFQTGAGNPVPVAAGRWVQTWNWRVTAIGGKPCTPFSIGDTIHHYYTVPGTPSNPMAEPWTLVLDRSCGWVNGRSTPEECIRALAENLNSCGAEWDTVQEYTRDGRLDLDRLLRDVEDPPGNFHLNCVDFSNFFTVLAASLGIPCACRRIVPVPPASAFRTRYILPAGKPNTYRNWQVMNFGVHQVCEWNGRIIDPAFRLHTYPSFPPDPVKQVLLPCGEDEFYGPFPESYQALFLEYPEAANLEEPETVEILAP